MKQYAKNTSAAVRRAIVVGATSGIGREVAVLLAAAGWQVAVAGRREELLVELAETVDNITCYAVMDVCSPKSVEALHSLTDKLGGIDLYFHSSGIGYQNPSLDMPREIATTETNVTGMTRLVGEMFNYFADRPQRAAHIAVISSIAGTKGLGAAPSYSASKRYVNHYMECLQQLCAIRRLRHLRLHDIRPGFVRTALLGNGGSYPLQLDATDVARQIIQGIHNNKTVITVDWRYRLLVFFWRLIPRCLWVRMRIATKK